jgi:hypothetical protein
LDTYPHVFFTADTEWHPQNTNDENSVNDLDIPDDDLQQSDYHLGSLDIYGDLIPSAHQHHVHLRTVPPNQPDLDTISPNFRVFPRLRIQHNLDHTTQFACLDNRFPLRKHFKSRFPAANGSRLNEVVATDTYFSDTPSLDNGIMGHGGTKMAQLFCDCSSLVMVYTQCGVRTILPVP